MPLTKGCPLSTTPRNSQPEHQARKREKGKEEGKQNEEGGRGDRRKEGRKKNWKPRSKTISDHR